LQSSGYRLKFNPFRVVLIVIDIATGYTRRYYYSSPSGFIASRRDITIVTSGATGGKKRKLNTTLKGLNKLDVSALKYYYWALLVSLTCTSCSLFSYCH
jgi:hypothetical protein